jgi:hypothetical protein
MRFAFGALHWTPDTFWRSSLPELACALQYYEKPKAASLSQTRLQDLMQQFPD